MSTEASALRVMPFGKFKGQPLYALPPEYFRWLVSQCWVPTKYPELYHLARERVLSILEDEKRQEARSRFRIVTREHADLSDDILALL